jgi:hypothetical protein
MPNLAVVNADPTPIHSPMDTIALGRIDDPKRAALLNSAVDVVVATSSTYGLEQTVIEAMARGTTVEVPARPRV